MFKAIVAFSDDIDTEDAIEEVMTQCDRQLAGLEPAAALLFAGTEYDHSLLLERINGHFPGIQLIGCTTDGEMSSSGGFSEDAITLTLLCTNRIRISVGFGSDAGTHPQQAARDAVEQCLTQLDEPPSLAIVLPDGLTTSAYQVLGSLGEILGPQVPIVGGMSADRVSMGKETFATSQFCGNQVLTDAVPLLLFSGPVIHSLGVESGWQPIGKRMRVTLSEGNLLHTLNDRPAFDFYVHYLGDVMKENLAGIGSYPLAVYEEGLDRFYLRVAKSADVKQGSIRFLGEIPEGAEVQITQAIRNEVIDGVNQSVESALKSFPGDRPGMAMMFSCTGRKIALGTRTRDEVGLVQSALGEDIPVTGFYSFGEIGPVADHARTRYHNTTFVTLLIGEEST